MAGDDQPKLFDRIDASKLQGALSNASMMGHLEVRLHSCCIRSLGAYAVFSLAYVSPTSLQYSLPL